MLGKRKGVPVPKNSRKTDKNFKIQDENKKRLMK